MPAQAFAGVVSAETSNSLLLFCISSADSITLRKTDTWELQEMERTEEKRITLWKFKN